MLRSDVVRAYLGETEKTTYFHLNLNKGPGKRIYPVLILVLRLAGTRDR